MFLIVTFVPEVSKDSDTEEDPSGVWLLVSWLRDNPSIYSLHNHSPPLTHGTNEKNLIDLLSARVEEPASSAGHV